AREVERSGADHEIDAEARRHDRDRRPRAPQDVGAQAGDLAGPQAPQPRAACRLGLPAPAASGPARLAGGPGAAALDLRRPLADPLAAVRAFGDVRADLRPAVLADDEEISSACHRAGPDDTAPRPPAWMVVGEGNA